MTIAIGAAYKDIKFCRKPWTYVLRIFVALPNFLSTANATKRDY